MSLGHITLDPASGKADCSVCKIGCTVPPSLGGIPRMNMLAAFVVEHSVHTKAGAPAGLTPAGRPTKAAKLAMGVQP